MKKYLFCFITLIFISSLFSQIENEKNIMTSITMISNNMSPNFIELKITIADNEVGNFTIFNIKGQEIITEQYATGEHRLSLIKSKYGSGLYFYKLNTNSFFKSGKILMLK